MLKKVLIAIAVAIAGRMALRSLAAWLIAHVEITPIDGFDDEEQFYEDAQLGGIVSQRMTEYEEAVELDKLDDNILPVNIRYIHLGDLSIPCPQCGTQVDVVGLGIGTKEDRETGEGEFNDMQSFGVIVYQCSHTFFSACLLNKVATIINAEEVGSLSPGMFENLTSCPEHGDSNGQPTQE